MHNGQATANRICRSVLSYYRTGQLVSKTDFNGQIITFAYDVDGRLTTKTYPDLSTVTTTYTDNRQVDTVTDSSGTIDYAYDDLNRLASVTRYDSGMNFQNEITYGYDWNGNRTSLTVDNGTTVETTTYTFDALNRLASVTDPDANATSYTYDAIGNRESVTYPNNTMASYVYDSLNRLTYLENKDLTTSAIISSYTYELGLAGNRLAVTEDTGRRVEYDYDGLYRLVDESIYDDGVNITDAISYTYDNVGNRLTKTDNSGTISHSYDANDRLLSAGGTSFTYDANGNTLSKIDASGTVTYVYDYENRLIQLDDPVNGLTGYAYDPLGNRLSKADSAGTTGYLVDTNQRFAQVLHESAPDSSLTTYVYGDDLISQDRAGVASYYHYDGNMSTRQLTDVAAVTTDTYTYDAFGNMLAQTGTTANHYLYTGEQYDPNAGFYYLRARYYNPEIGRFLTRDTHMGNCWEPQSLHKYGYAYNSPIGRVDPGGNFSTMTDIIIANAIIATIAAIAFPITFAAYVKIASLYGKEKPKPKIDFDWGFSLGNRKYPVGHCTKQMLLDAIDIAESTIKKPDCKKYFEDYAYSQETLEKALNADVQAEPWWTTACYKLPTSLEEKDSYVWLGDTIHICQPPCRDPAPGSKSDVVAVAIVHEAFHLASTILDESFLTKVERACFLTNQ